MDINFMRPPDWMSEASCAGMIDDALWFPASGDRVDPHAKAICKLCPVSTQCLTYAIQTRSEGVWAGTSSDQRRRSSTAVGRRICGVAGCDAVTAYQRRYCGPEHRAIGQAETFARRSVA